MTLRRRLTLEPLEARTLLTTLGGPWPSPRDLTLSFAPDSTQIGLFESELFATLGRNRTAAVWQTDILRAFQTWAAVADVDIGLVGDTGRPFGAAGLAQGDPRFGDFRIGAFPQAHAIASAVPYRAVAGSWSGDVFLNSSLAVGLHSADIDLYSVLLNEAGNALGLADNNDAESVMYTNYRGQRSGLSPQDVSAIRSLYGERQPDALEGGGGNDIATTATLLPTTLHGGVRTVAIDADIHAPGDVDYYRIPVGEGGRVSVRLIATGESLLVGSVDVMRNNGAVVVAGSAASPLANNVDVVTAMTPLGGDVLVRVAGKANDVFGVGRYRLEIKLRSGETPPIAAPSPDDAHAGELLLATGQVRSYPAVNGYLDDEIGENDTLAAATVLESPFGYVPDSRYEAIGSIRSVNDADVFRITAPATGDRRLTVHLDSFDVRYFDFHIGLYDENGNLLAQEAAPHADGRIVLDFSEIEASQAYFLRIASGGPGSANLGNYVFVADFIREDPDLAQIGYGTLTTAVQRDVQRWHVERTLLYRFDLRPEGGVPGAGVRFEIVDREGGLVGSMVVPTGVASTEYVWLPAGSFDFVFQAATAEGFTPITYSLSAAALSDDVGPGLIDSTENLLPGDADRSGVVDRGDVATVASDYGRFSVDVLSPADFDGDGDVDLDDLVTVATNLGRALLPDLFTSTSTGGGLAPGSASAIVLASVEESATGIVNADHPSLTALRAGRSARSPTAVTTSNARRVAVRLVDIAVGELPQSGASRLFAERDAAAIRRRRSV